MPHSRLRQLTCYFALVSMVSFSAGWSREVDPQNRSLSSGTRLLFALNERLDKQGIDVLYKFGNPTTDKVPARPRLAPIADFPTPSNAAVDRLVLNDVDFANWLDAYKAANHRSLAAVKTGGAAKEAKSLAEFRQEWKKADPDKRVFISYTSKNQQQASVIKRELLADGYTVYTFLDETGSFTMGTLAETAEFMKTATHRLVIDSAAARTSKGVQIEAKYGAVVNAYNGKVTDISGRTEKSIMSLGDRFGPKVQARMHPKGGHGGIASAGVLTVPEEKKTAERRFENQDKSNSPRVAAKLTCCPGFLSRY